MAGNGDLDISTLRVLQGFLPYADGANFRAVTEADHSNMVLAGILTDAVNMATDFERDMHQPLTYGEAYRPGYVQDWRITEHAHGGPLAAPVVDGQHTSNHGWGLCKDYRNGIGNGPGSTTYQWMHDHAAEYGYVNDVNGEYWHWHHPNTYSITAPRGTSTAGTGTTTEIEDDMTPEQAQMLTDINKRTQTTRDNTNHLVSGEQVDALLDAFVARLLNANVDPNSNPQVGKVYQALRDSRQGTFTNQTLLKLIAEKLGLKAAAAKLGIKL